MLWTAFTIGLFGSLHCVGMCGPLVLALPPGPPSRLGQLQQVLLYNGGRILTYSLLGLLIGTFGLGARLAGMQSFLSIVSGLILLVVALRQIPVEPYLLRWSLFGRLQVWLRRQFARQWTSNATPAYFRLGMLNGLLPCGLVYLAIVGALSMEHLSYAMLYMVLFGAGTFPLMAATVFFGQASSRTLRKKLWVYYPILLSAVSVWLIYRGIQFSLPTDVSVWNIMSQMPMCH